MNSNGSAKSGGGFSNAFVKFFDTWTPNSIVFAYMLTFVIAILALIFTDTPLLFDSGENMSLVNSWVSGFWNLLTFAMQMSLIMITGSIVATSPPVKKALIWIATKPNSKLAYFVFMAVISFVLSWIHWGIGMMVGIQMGRQFLVAARDKGIHFSQAYFCAAAYAMLPGSVGISQAAPLLGSTPGYLRTLVPEEIAPLIPEVTPLTESVLTPVNIAQCLILFALVSVVLWFVQPKEGQVGDELYNEVKAQNEVKVEKKRKATGPADWIDNSPLTSWIIGGFGAFWVIRLLATSGFIGLSINNYNFLMLILGILLCGSPNNFIKGAQGAVSSVWGVIMQFPLYAGIFGIIVYTGLSGVIVDFFLSFSTQDNFPLVTYIYSAILNMAVPSGGSKFAIEAPYLLAICAELNVPIGSILNSYTFGDMTTNIIQPFWALPYLALFKIDFKQILPYTMFACAAAIVINCAFFIFAY